MATFLFIAAVICFFAALASLLIHNKRLERKLSELRRYYFIALGERDDFRSRCEQQMQQFQAILQSKDSIIKQLTGEYTDLASKQENILHVKKSLAKLSNSLLQGKGDENTTVEDLCQRIKEGVEIEEDRLLQMIAVCENQNSTIKQLTYERDHLVGRVQNKDDTDTAIYKSLVAISQIATTAIRESNDNELGLDDNAVELPFDPITNEAPPSIADDVQRVIDADNQRVANATNYGEYDPT